jgi:hypothetical protein
VVQVPGAKSLGDEIADGPSDDLLAAGLPLRPRRFREGLRVVLLPEAHPARRPEDRRRLRQQPEVEPTDQLVVRHMAEIAGELGLFTIAEFVEDAETMELLRDYGVDAVQGFHIGEPEPAHDLERLVVPEENASSRLLEDQPEVVE